MRTMKINDVIVHMVTKVVVCIILTLAFYLFISGQDHPGVGVIAGLVLASAVVLLFVAFDIATIEQGLAINFMIVGATCAFIVVATGLSALFFGKSFLTQGSIQLPVTLLGKIELTTVTLFDAGVALAVVGVVITVILSISRDVYVMDTLIIV